MAGALSADERHDITNGIVADPLTVSRLLSEYDFTKAAPQIGSLIRHRKNGSVYSLEWDGARAKGNSQAKRVATRQASVATLKQRFHVYFSNDYGDDPDALVLGGQQPRESCTRREVTGKRVIVKYEEEEALVPYYGVVVAYSRILGLSVVFDGIYGKYVCGCISVILHNVCLT